MLDSHSRVRCRYAHPTGNGSDHGRSIPFRVSHASPGENLLLLQNARRARSSSLTSRAPRPRRAWSAPERIARRAASPLLAAALVVVLADTVTQGLGAAALMVACLLLARRLIHPHEWITEFAPLLRAIHPLLAPGLTFLALVFLKLTSVLAGLTAAELAAACALAAVVAVLSGVASPVSTSGVRPLRIAVVGPAWTASELAGEVLASRRAGFRVVGYVDPDPDRPAAHGAVPRLGTLGGLSGVVTGHRIDLLLVSPETPRLAFFDEVAETCSALPVRVVELTAFYEQTFGHVPLAAINAAWFQWVMHPRYSRGVPPLKRSLDLLIAAVAALAFGPVLLVLMAVIKRDGGPVFFRQTRIGEGGQPFSILKLRTMRVAPPAGGDAPWCAADDDRITRVGRFLRKTHLDEVPQILNVLRGEMSIVGPRPEQPSYVERLEEALPFYSRRHMIRPGITGWAQIHCGYAGSDEGTRWKLCHDLYYLKHRSTVFDLVILLETLRTLVRDDQQFGVAVPTRAFVSARPAAERVEVTA
jgi:exopolysaccharide biosynthesis polyprenyl glycosylphosphotransferase